MLMPNLFFQTYCESAIGAKNRMPRIDEVPYFITLPFVLLFARLRLHPNQVVLVSFFCSMAVIYGVLVNWQTHELYLMLILIMARVLLDCADGQLARYSSLTSSVGALYDLIADFIFALLFLAAAGYSVIVVEEIAPLLAFILSFGAFVSLVVTATIASFLSRLSNQPMDSVDEVKAQFVDYYKNDQPGNRWYAVKLRILNHLFCLSWRSVSVLIFSMLIRKGGIRNRRMVAQLTAPFEFGTHWIICGLILWIWQSLYIFLIYEIVAFFLALVLVLLLTRKHDLAV